MLFIPVQNTPMRTPVIDQLWYYDGIFSSSGVGSSIGSGCDMSYQDEGQGLSCGQGHTNSYYSYANQGYVSIGFGQGTGTGSGYEYEHDDKPECVGTPFVYGFIFNDI